MRFLLLVFLLHVGRLQSQYLWQIHQDTVKKWSYVDGDEFNSENFDKDKWKPNFPWSVVVPEQEAVIRENNIKFDKGLASFLVNKDSSITELFPWQIDSVKFKKNNIKLIKGNRLATKYSIGLLWMNKAYKYGYFEIKFLAPWGQGIWPAFWLYAGNENNEIDFMELKGEKENALHVDIHCPDGCSNYKKSFLSSKSWGHWLKLTPKLNAGYNVVAGEWTPSYIKYYLNGRLIAYTEHKFNMGMHLIVGTGIAKDGAAFQPGPDQNTAFPNVFAVDYVRIFQSDTLPTKTGEKSSMDVSHAETTLDTLNFQAQKVTKKLANNKNKKLKIDKLITLSVVPLSKQIISFRALGIDNTDSLLIKFTDPKGYVIKTMTPKKNTEANIRANGNFVDLQMDVNGKKINERIFLSEEI